MIWVGNWTRYPRPAMVGPQLYGVDVNLIQMWIDWSQSELRVSEYTLVHALLHLEVLYQRLTQQQQQQNMKEFQ